MNKINITRKRISYPSGKTKDEFFLFAPCLVETIPGVRVRLGGRKNLIHLRNKINKYLEEYENEQQK